MARNGLPQPAPLRPGSRILAVNPGTWLPKDLTFMALQQRCAAEGWRLEGLDGVLGQWRYFSGTDSTRRRQMEEAWTDPAVEAVLYVGAGWGSARVLEAGFRFPKRPRWALGFSDCSALLLAQCAAGLGGAIHGSSGGPEQQWRRTADLLAGRAVADLKGRGVRPGWAEGALLVTNLTVATHLIGTPWLPSLRHTILVLEDVEEAPYRVDRMLTQWRTSGLLDGVAGVACGRFSWTGEAEPGDFSMSEILEERLGDLGVPLVLDLPLGHGLPNQALPLGVPARLDGSQGRLSLIRQTGSS
ncbi:LD-carboxypeptidase [Synechococcus sp. RSCCF101]|uniref:S66 peptidase family protein n=1 Tax=Synechococcus sp. RSCCF101 TaxID=2511069 RepID=UPI001CD99360|nr:LD-carboxypeptidase [Synechococcus sp. RSCCF101]